MEKPRHSAPKFCIVHECDIVATAITTQHPTATLQLNSAQLSTATSIILKNHSHCDASTPCHIVKADHSHVSKEVQQHILTSFNEKF